MSSAPRVRDLVLDTPVFLWKVAVPVFELPTAWYRDENGDHVWTRIAGASGPLAPGTYRLRGYGPDEFVVYATSDALRADSLGTLLHRYRSVGLFSWTTSRQQAEQLRLEAQSW